MSFVAVKVKIMPSSPDIDLEEIKSKITEKIEAEEGKINNIEEEPIAFGLKAVIVTLAWLETKESSILEDSLSSIENVSSVQIIDYRRAFG
ncbi:MAG: elongation factor 1-beta [archaeon]